ncbi:MAG: CPBP family intramembrane metalloprotease [Bacteroidales bacterium]|nr:CPBP family intramembrane metalloprotease [Bacteroidales bacterium]
MLKFFRSMGCAGRLGIFLLMFIAALILSSIIMTVMLLATGNATQPTTQFLLFSQGITQILTFLVPALVFAWLFNGNANTFFQTSFKKWQFAPALLAILLIITSIPMIDLLSNWNTGLHLPQSLKSVEDTLRASGEKSDVLVKSFMALPGWGYFLLNLLIMAVIPAVCEEFVFRGVVQKTMAEWLRNPHVAIIIVAAIFSITHFDLFLFVPRFVLGIFLGYIYYYTKTIWASTLAHFANNATVVVLFYCNSLGLCNINPTDMQLPQPVLFAIVSTVVTISILIFLIKICNKNTQNYEKSPTSETK